MLTLLLLQRQQLHSVCCRASARLRLHLQQWWLHVLLLLGWLLWLGCRSNSWSGQHEPLKARLACITCALMLLPQWCGE
jgi:hypothetical protein